MNEITDPPRRTQGSSFRRVGITVAAVCVVAGSIAGLGSMGALATSFSSPAERATLAAPSEPSTQPAPKVTYTDEDLAAVAASPFSGDALNLAVVWGIDTETAQGKAGAKVLGGQELPFLPGEAATASYTDEERRAAFFSAQPDVAQVDFTQTLGLAIAWGTGDITAAKAKVGGLLLAHEPIPAAPTSYSEEQEALAFTLAGYEASQASVLANLWQTDTRTATVRAGAALLANENLPL